MISSDSDSAFAALWDQARRLKTQEEANIQLKQFVVCAVEHQEGLLTALNNCIANLSLQSSSNPEATKTKLASPTTKTVPLIPPQLARQEKFSGVSGDCWSFLTQCELHFELQAVSFQTGWSKIAFLISHLTGRAEAWATTECSRRSHLCESFSLFSLTFFKRFLLDGRRLDLWFHYDKDTTQLMSLP